jgi:hypothetical protein
MKTEGKEEMKEEAKLDANEEAKTTEEAPKEKVRSSRDANKNSGFFGKIAAKQEAMEKDIEAKYPKVSANLNYFKEVWAETFPNSDVKLNKKMAHRRKIAQMQREAEERQESMTPEELEEYEKSIPEWKRNALVATDPEAAVEKKGMFGKLKEKVSSTEAGKKFYESEEYGKIKDARANFREFKDTLKESTENS